jgi:hypothetical protein
VSIVASRNCVRISIEKIQKSVNLQKGIYTKIVNAVIGLGWFFLSGEWIIILILNLVEILMVIDLKEKCICIAELTYKNKALHPPTKCRRYNVRRDEECGWTVFRSSTKRPNYWTCQYCFYDSPSEEIKEVT